MEVGAMTSFDGNPLVSGAFQVRFADERSTRAAARDATGAGFVVEVRSDGMSGWLIVCQRRQSFPADEQDRYAGRLRNIALRNGGAYDRFVAE